jgi:hypothetical protein
MEIERGSAVVASVDAEHLADDTEFERRHLGNGDTGDGVEHGPSGNGRN